jgi:predicted transcriptional regulator
MQTIRLRINDRIYDKLIWLLSKFNTDEIEIISENAEFIENQNYLNSELNEIIQGKAKFVDINEVNEKLDTIIAKNENPI